jgi:hypothetical protein
MEEAAGSYDNEFPPQRWGGGAQRLSNKPIPLLSLSPPTAQEEVDDDNNRLRAIVDKTGQQKMMKVGGTGRKGKGRRGGITLFNRVIDINAVDTFLIFSIRKVGSMWPPLLKDDSL